HEAAMPDGASVSRIAVTTARAKSQRIAPKFARSTRHKKRHLWQNMAARQMCGRKILSPMPRSTFTIPRLSLPAALLISLAIIAVAAGVEYGMGRIPMCKCGTIKLWHGGRGDWEMSQHL